MMFFLFYFSKLKYSKMYLYTCSPNFFYHKVINSFSTNPPTTRNFLRLNLGLTAFYKSYYLLWYLSLTLLAYLYISLKKIFLILIMEMAGWQNIAQVG